MDEKKTPETLKEILGKPCDSFSFEEFLWNSLGALLWVHKTDPGLLSKRGETTLLERVHKTINELAHLLEKPKYSGPYKSTKDLKTAIKELMEISISELKRIGVNEELMKRVYRAVAKEHDMSKHLIRTIEEIKNERRKVLKKDPN